MPRKNIYIRIEDEERWNDIVDKPAYIHQMLNREIHLPESAILFAQASGAIKNNSSLKDFLKYCANLSANHITFDIDKMYEKESIV